MRISDWSSDVCSSDLEPVRPHVAHRQHDVRVGLGTAVLRLVPMHVQVRDHPAIDKLRLHEILRERDALLLVHLARNRELHLTGKLRVLALRSEEHTSELQSIMRISYAVFCLQKKTNTI